MPPFANHVRRTTNPPPKPTTRGQTQTPSYVFHPIARLRWLYTRIRAERHDPLGRSPGALFQPDDAVRWRARSFHEILGRKMIEAEYALQEVRLLSLVGILERAAEHLVLMCWWKAEWHCYAFVWWIFQTVVPTRHQWLAETPWWWGNAVCVWWTELLVARPGETVRVRHRSLRDVKTFVCEGDMVIFVAATTGAVDRWGGISGRLDDLVKLTMVFWQISWCLACFYLWAAKTRALAYPRCVIRSARGIMGIKVESFRADIELPDLD